MDPLNTLWRWGLKVRCREAGRGRHYGVPATASYVGIQAEHSWPGPHFPFLCCSLRTSVLACISLSFLSLLKTLISLHQTPITFAFVIPNRIVIFSVSCSFLYLPLSFHFLLEFSHIEYLLPCLQNRYKPPRSPQATIANMGSSPLVWGVRMWHEPQGSPRHSADRIAT